MHLMLQIYTIILIADTKIDSEFENLEINKSYLLFGVMVRTRREQKISSGKKKKALPGACPSFNLVFRVWALFLSP